MGHHLGVLAGEAGEGLLVEGAQLLAGQRRRRHRPSDQIGELGDPHRALLGGDHGAVVVRLEHLPGAPLAGAGRGFADQQHPAAGVHDLREEERARVARPVVERADERDDLRRVLVAPTDHAEVGRPVGLPEVGPLAQVLLLAEPLALVVRLQAVEHVGEAGDRRGVASGVQLEGRHQRLHLDLAAREHAALVDAALDAVPGHAVDLLLVHQGPVRRVQARVARERSVVEVDRAPLRLGDHRVGDDAQVRDAEEDIVVFDAIGEALAGCDHLETFAFRPADQLSAVGDHTADAMPAVLQDL